MLFGVPVLVDNVLAGLHELKEARGLGHDKIIHFLLPADQLDVTTRLWHNVKSHAGVDQRGGIEADVKHLRLPLPFFDAFLGKKDGCHKVLLAARLGLVAKMRLHDDALGPHQALGGMKMGWMSSTSHARALQTSRRLTHLTKTCVCSYGPTWSAE